MSELDDISSGNVADSSELTNRIFNDELRSKFDFFSYRSAAAILTQSFPEQFQDIISALERLRIDTGMIRRPGGSKGEIAKHVDELFSDDWQEVRIQADLHVKLLPANRSENAVREYIRKGYLDGHRIDFLHGKVALDLEWNSKDQTYDRDLNAFSAFYDAGAIDVGVIITRSSKMDNAFFRSLGRVLTRDDEEGTDEVYKKFGASTTWMGKLLYRLDAGRNGGCPVLAIGIRPEAVWDYRSHE